MFYASPDISARRLPTLGTHDRSLAHKVPRALPDAWIRWDNETGHGTSTPDNVEKFVSLAQQHDVPMIIAASAVDGYDNFWALNYGKLDGQPDKQVTITIKDIADGPYLAQAYGLLHPQSTPTSSSSRPSTNYQTAFGSSATPTTPTNLELLSGQALRRLLATTTITF